jgi:hypothetical protein
MKAGGQPVEPVLKLRRDDAQSLPGPAAGASGKETRITLKEIQELRGIGMSPEQVVDNVAERGRCFEVTAEVSRALRGLGFQPVQIDAIRESSAGPLVPGKWVKLTNLRPPNPTEPMVFEKYVKNKYWSLPNPILEYIKVVASESGIAIRPIQLQHVTFWVSASAPAGPSGSAERSSPLVLGHSSSGNASEETQQVYVRDVQKLEKFFHTKCGEPIRSGLDRRYAHVILLKDHAEWEIWWRTVARSRWANLTLIRPGEHSDQKFILESVLKQQGFCYLDFCVISGPVTNRMRRLAVGGIAFMYLDQLSRFGCAHGPLQGGFIDMAENAVFGSPSLTFKDLAPIGPAPEAGVDGQDWGLLVRERMTRHQATSVATLFNMDFCRTFLQPHYAEGWTLVELLNRQPAKYGKLLLELHETDQMKPGSTLAVLKRVYGWDATELTKQWRAYVMSQGSKEVPNLGKLEAAAVETDEQHAESGAKRPDGDAQPVPEAAAGGDEKDTRITLKEIQALRGRRMPAGEVAETLAERGRAFEVTTAVAGQLRRLGFTATQIEAVREAADEPLVAGKSLSSFEWQRDQIREEMKQVVAKSKLDIEPVESQHATLWAAKYLQHKCLADVQKVEKFFHTRCAEPIRSGLDKRTTHIILLKDHAEYEAWWRAMFALFGEQFEEEDNPGANAHFREEVLKRSAFYSNDFAVVCVAGLSADQMHRSVVAGVAGMYSMQLARPQRRQRELGALETGFINWIEAAVFGYPRVVFGAIVYHQETRFPANSAQAWGLLVRQRMARNGATPLAELLEMDHSKMSEAHYAEAWTLVELLASQRGKFGKLLLATREGASGLEAVEKVYGWDERKLSKEWRAHVMGREKERTKPVPRTEG